MTEDTTGTPHEPGPHAGTPREPGPHAGFPREPGSWTGIRREPGGPAGAPYEPGSPTRIAWAPGGRAGVPHEPDWTGAPYEPDWAGTPREPGSYAGTPHEPGSYAGTPREPGNHAGAPHEPESHAGAPREPGSQWYDHEAGPLVRPYAVTGGRTAPGPSGARFDLIALVALDPAAPAAGDPTLGPEHRALIDLCRPETQSVAELAAGADLPVGVVRVLLGDLLERGRVTVSRPVPPAHLPDERVLREVIAGLRAL